MIKHVDDVLLGPRRSLDNQLMPEDEFNPIDPSTSEDDTSADLSDATIKNIQQDMKKIQQVKAG